MLKYRICTSLILALFVILMLFYSSDIIWFLFVGLIVSMCSYEYLSFFKLKTIDKTIYLLITILIGIMVYYCRYFINIFYYRNFLFFIPFIFWIFCVPMFLYFKFRLDNKFLIYFFGLILFLPFWYFMYCFRNIEIFSTRFNEIILLSIMCFIWVFDIGSYFSGKIFGKHKLAINISPGKTIEGYVGGLLFVYLYFFILSKFNNNIIKLDLIDSLLLVFFLGNISLLGDLFESFLKRSANLKDSGKILPGHGGIFDRIDSMISIFGVLPFTFFIIDLMK